MQGLAALVIFGAICISYPSGGVAGLYLVFGLSACRLGSLSLLGSWGWDVGGCLLCGGGSGSFPGKGALSFLRKGRFCLHEGLTLKAGLRNVFAWDEGPALCNARNCSGSRDAAQ